MLIIAGLFIAGNISPYGEYYGAHKKTDFPGPIKRFLQRVLVQ